jgi:hypothetical protein
MERGEESRVFGIEKNTLFDCSCINFLFLKSRVISSEILLERDDFSP